MYLFSQLTPLGSAGCFLLPRFLSSNSRQGLCSWGGQTLSVVAPVVGEHCLLGGGAGVFVGLQLC